jgi:hypothetical protein
MTLIPNIAQINAAAKGNKDLRETLLSLHLGLQSVQTQGPIKKVDAVATKSAGPPGQSQLLVTGANGIFTVTITLPQSASGSAAPTNPSNQAIYQELSSSTSANFSANVTKYPLSTNTLYTFTLPGQTLYWRLRGTYDQKTYNQYTVQPGAVSSGLQSSAATSPNLPLSQTNFARIDSIGAGGTATIRVYGSGGVGTAWTSILGTASKVIPAGTILNVTYGSTVFVAWDGARYQLKPSLSQAFPDTWIPVGATSVISNGSGLSLPTITPVISTPGGNIIGFNITGPGNDITGPLTFVIYDSGGGTGATVGPATITAGALTALGAGNPGALYTPATTVTASGGISGGVSGGGGAQGTNGGRLFGLTTNGA